MSLNGFTLNSRPVNGPGGAAAVTGAGTLVSLQQIVANIGSGSLFEIEQEVVFLETGSGTLVSIEQSTQTIASGGLITLVQRVVDQSIPNRESRTGWDLSIIVGGVEIPTDQVHGMVNITKEEDNSTLARFTIIPPVGVQDLESYEGKTVTIDVHSNNTSSYRVFTGVIDIPDVDIIEQKITFSCTNRRRELINTNLEAYVETVGFYDSNIFSEVDTAADELDQRLSTIPYSFDFDGNNNGFLTPWEPKLVADFVFFNSDIYYRDPDIETPSRGRIINTVNLEFEYRYPRLYHKEVTYSWTAPYTATNSACLIIGQGYSLTPKASIEAAVGAAGWILRDGITYTDLPPNGFYRCGDSQGYFTTIKTTVSTQAKREPSTFDEDGNEVLGAIITDSNGKPVPDTSTTKRDQVSDLRDVFTGGASWRATKRWAQDISEKYSITVAASQSVAQFGTIARDQSFGVVSTYNTDNWEDYRQFSGPGGSYFIDADFDSNVFKAAVVTAMNIASTTIQKSHRDTRVTFFRSLLPNIELHHTVQTSATKIACKGKVRRIEHNLDVGTGEAVTNIELALSRASGSSSSTPIVPPTRPSDSPSLPTQVITLGNHYGQDPSQTGAELWTGMIGNAYTGPYGSGVRTAYPESFVVDAPGISTEFRAQRILTASQSYNVAIRNDLLTVTFVAT